MPPEVRHQSTSIGGVNRIILELKRKEPMIKIEADLRELMGHTPFEVYIGAALGIGVAWLWLFLAGLKILNFLLNFPIFQIFYKEFTYPIKSISNNS